LDESALAELLQIEDAGEHSARVRQTTLGVELSPEEGWLEVGARFDRFFNEWAAALGRDCPDGTVVDFFGLQEECRLLKRYAKARLEPAEGERLGAAGRAGERPSEWAQMDEADGARPVWQEALVLTDRLAMEGRDTRGPSQGPRAWLVDLIFDGALLRAELALADEVARRWAAGDLAEAIVWWVELQCLLVVARAQRWPERLGVVQRYFGLPIGDAEWLGALYELEGADPAVARLKWQTALEGALDGALLAREAEITPSEEGAGAREVERVARLGDQALMQRVRAFRWVPFGPETVFGYLWGLRAEADNLKAVVGGVQAGVPPEVIRQQLRPTYV